MKTEKETWKENITEKIISLEKQAMELWNKGNPDGFLELSDEDVIYFDPSLKQKLEGMEQLRTYYEGIRGLVNVDWYEMIRPVVQATDNMAVLAYNHNCTESGKLHKWYCTEVYRRTPENEWKIIQTHWSHPESL